MEQRPDGRRTKCGHLSGLVSCHDDVGRRSFVLISGRAQERRQQDAARAGAAKAHSSATIILSPPDRQRQTQSDRSAIGCILAKLIAVCGLQQGEEPLAMHADVVVSAD